LNQSELIKTYADKYREKFNEELFVRNENDIIEELKKIILSCQRDKFFIIKVLSFRVIEDYKEINDILYNYEEYIINKSSKNKDKKRKDNKYDFINLKDFDIKLLIVKYFIKIKDEQEVINVLIAVPRIIDKYYMRLNGNVYSAMYQIVDASTYNNSTSNSSKRSITLRTKFQAIRIYRNQYPIKTTNKEVIKAMNFRTNVFSKSVYVISYIFAKYGYYEGLKMLGLDGSIFISDSDPKNENWYTFTNIGVKTTAKKNERIFVSTPKYLFDNNYVVQSLIHTVIESIGKNTNIEEMFKIEFWLKMLGSRFNTNSEKFLEKGLSILDSLEFVYDLPTRDSIHLPWEKKKDIYNVLKWMVGEFSALRLKDNLNIITKKIRYAEYIASLYAMKLSTALYKISHQGNQANINSIKKAIMIRPMELIKQITKCRLVNYKNMVNDTDSIMALKYSYKDVGSKTRGVSNTVPYVSRLLHISTMGITDPDSSSTTDPGVTGFLCPMVKIYDGHFSEFDEPNSWEEEFKKTMSSYKALVGMREVIRSKRGILNIDTEKDQEESIEESIKTVRSLIKPIRKLEDNDLVFGYLPVEEGEVIVYE